VKLVNNRIRAIRSSGAAHGILIGDPTTPNPSKDILISGNLVERILGASAAYGIRVNNGAATQTGFTTVAIRDNIIGRPSINPFDRVSGLSANGIALDGPTPNVEVVRNSITSVEGTEINAVVFRDNRFFSTAEVHFNNFDVTSLGFGIKVDAALMNAWGKWGNVDGRCNWWGDPNGPSGGGRSSTGAQVSARVDFDPWLDAPAPGGKCFDPHDKCDKDDDDDHDHDGTRNDKDEDVDNDGLLNLLDLDDDNDGIADLVDADDDNDGIEDVYDDKSTRQVQRTLHHTLGAGGISEWMLASDGGALPLVSLIESPNAQFLRVEVYNPSGVLVGTSVPTPGVAVVTTSALLPGIYTVRVRNIGVAPIDYTTKLITTMAWY
jgi:hypothetical protein